MSTSVKFSTPSPLTLNETHDSLTQWKLQFINFYRKDWDFKPLLVSSVKWDATKPNYGFEKEDLVDHADNLEVLLGSLASYLPFPYLTPRILTESKNLSDVWSIIFSHYNAEPSQDTNLDFISLRLNTDRDVKESYQTFYERLCHHQRTHLVKRGAEIQGVKNSGDDPLTFSHQNLIAQFWLLKIHPELPAKVSVEFTSDLQAGVQIAHLVPRISRKIDQLIQSAVVRQVGRC